MERIALDFDSPSVSLLPNPQLLSIQVDLLALPPTCC